MGQDGIQDVILPPIANRRTRAGLATRRRLDNLPHDVRLLYFFCCVRAAVDGGTIPLDRR